MAINKEDASTHLEIDDFPEIINDPAYDPDAPNRCISEKYILRFNESLKQKAHVSKQECKIWTQHLEYCRSCKINFQNLVDDPAPTADPTWNKLNRKISRPSLFLSEMKAMRYDVISSNYRELPKSHRVVEYDEGY